MFSGSYSCGLYEHRGSKRGLFFATKTYTTGLSDQSEPWIGVPHVQNNSTRDCTRGLTGLTGVEVAAHQISLTPQVIVMVTALRRGVEPDSSFAGSPVRLGV